MKFKFRDQLRTVAMVFIAFISFVVSTAAYSATPAIKVNLNQNNGDVEFLAIGRPSFLKIKGEKASVKGQMVLTSNRLSARLRVAVSEFDTGMELRNRHMKEDYLHTGRYPQAELKISKLPLPKDLIANPSAEISSLPFTGKLKLHGVEKPVSGTAQLIRDGKQLKGEAKFSIDLTDFAIDIPSFKGITVAKKVTITAKIDSPIQLVQLRKGRKK